MQSIWPKVHMDLNKNINNNIIIINDKIVIEIK